MRLTAWTLTALLMLCVGYFNPILGYETAGNQLEGLRLDYLTGNTLNISFNPTIHGWDTLIADGTKYLVPHIDGASYRQSADASTRQWLVSFDFPISAQDGYTVESTSSSTTSLDIELQPGYTPEGIVIPTRSPIGTDINIIYSGIARDRHLARVECVVVETRNGITTLRDKFTANIRLINNVKTIPVKKREEVQGFETLGDVYQIPITEEGIYRITSQQLKDAGIPTDAVAAGKLHIYGRGGTEVDEKVESESNVNLLEQDIIVRTNNDGSISEIVFYASGPSGFEWRTTGPGHYIHHYALNAGYLLTVGGQDGLRSVLRKAETGTPDNRPLTVTGYVFNEEEMVNPYNTGSGRKWLGKTVENGGALTITTMLPGFIKNGVVNYRMVLAHRGAARGTFKVFENNAPLVERDLNSPPQYMDTYSGPASGSLYANTLSADGRSVLRFEYRNQDVTASGLLDWFEIQYPRGMIADDNEFWFFSDPALGGVSEYTVNGFSGSEIFAFDVTNRSRPIRVENVAPSGGLCSIREEYDSAEVRRYYITSRVRSADLHRISFANLRAIPLNAELIVITHSTLKSSAEQFAEYRKKASGLSVGVVTTEDIFNEFSYGVMDPTAIRDFLRHALTNWSVKPKYVLLWGDGHFDYKGIATKVTNYVIPYESLDPDDANWGINTTTTDDFYVRVAGTDTRIDVAIGRLPVTSNALGEQLLDKIKQYETESSDDDWRTRVGLVADDGATTNGKSDRTIHLDQTENLARYYLPESIQPKKVYLVEYPTENVAKGRRKPAVTAEYVSAVNTTGLLILNWIGHGNPRVWAHEIVFERETTPPTMTNNTKYFFVSAATCDFARFDVPETQSGSEVLVMMKGGGAIGAFSATRVVYSFDNAQINQEFYKNLFSILPNGNVPTLGDVMFNVKQRLSGSNDEKFILMADPSMRLAIPNNDVVFDSINGVQIGTEPVVIKALSTITLSGHISRPGQTSVYQSFNGLATVSLTDAEQNLTVIDNDGYSTVNRFIMPGPALSRGSFKVENGMFTATFVVPKDIAYSSGNARIYGYAISDDKQLAKGTTNRVIVDGVSGNNYEDFAGPDISVYLDSRYFVSGDVVRSNPVLIVDLTDDTGINTTGIGIGHDIEAVFNNGQIVSSLTSDFTTSPESPRAGTATKQIFGLPSGEHIVRVRAWDVFNNMSEAYTTFRIANADDGLVTSWVMNYPNPFSESTTVRFRHNTAQPFNARIRIYDVQGRIVSESEMEIRDMQTAEFVWDGRDGNGLHLGSGVYNCVIRITDRLGNTTDVAGKLALIH